MNKKPFIDSRISPPNIRSSYSFHESEISPVFTKIKTKDGASYNLVKERSKRSNKFTFYILRKAPSVSIKEIDSMFLLQTSRKIDWKKWNERVNKSTKDFQKFRKKGNDKEVIT